jgi:hypothetical protein
MNWVVTGYSSHFDGILYVVEAETEEGACKRLAEIRSSKYSRIDADSKPHSVAGVGLDDTDVFTNDECYDVLVKSNEEFPTWETLDTNEDFHGWILRATPLKVDDNLWDAVQW